MEKKEKVGGERVGKRKKRIRVEGKTCVGGRCMQRRLLWEEEGRRRGEEGENEGCRSE